MSLRNSIRKAWPEEDVMALRDIVKDPDPVLRRHSRPVEVFDAKLGKLLDDMRETMLAADGVGLAAPQVGLLRRVAVIETEDGYFEFINPAIVASSGSQRGAEGCLSVPGKSATVVRPMKVTVEYFDRKGKKHKEEFEGLTARACCHEFDHLDGVLYYDKAEKEGNA